MFKERDFLTKVAFIIACVSLLVAIVTGYKGAYVASNTALIILFSIWIIWVTYKIIKVEDNMSKTSNKMPSSKETKLPYKLLHHEIESPRLIDDIKRKVKIPCDFLREGHSFTMIFWVQITEQFCNTTQNRYLFAYTTDPTNNPDENKQYPNAFYLGIEGETINWRFMIKGPDPAISTKIPLSTAENLHGWRMFTVRWLAGKRRISLSVDAGKAFNDHTIIKKDGFPTCGGKGHLFHLGGWLDTWKGGISLLKFYNFRVYDVYLSDEDITKIYNSEKEFTNNQ